MATLVHAIRALLPPLAAMCASLTERLLTLAEIDDIDGRRLLASARRLRLATRDGSEVRLLGNRHVAIAGEVDGHHRDDPFEIAAKRLGAHVSRIGSYLLLGDTPQAEATTARMLPRLYDALECPASCAERALALHRQSGVPVYVGLSGAGHPIRRLLPEMTNELGGPPDDALTLLIQAVLVETLT